jgi:hypothetical protein
VSTVERYVAVKWRVVRPTTLELARDCPSADAGRFFAGLQYARLYLGISNLFVECAVPPLEAERDRANFKRQLLRYADVFQVKHAGWVRDKSLNIVCVSID